MYQVIIVEDDPMVAEIDKQYVEHNSKMAIAGIFQNGQGRLGLCAHPSCRLDHVRLLHARHGRAHLSRQTPGRGHPGRCDHGHRRQRGPARQRAVLLRRVGLPGQASTTTASKPPCRSSWPGSGRAFSGDKAFNQEELDKVIAPEASAAASLWTRASTRSPWRSSALPAAATAVGALIEDIAKNVSFPGDPAAA